MEVLVAVSPFIVFILVYTIMYFVFIPNTIKHGRDSANLYYDLYYVKYPILREHGGPGYAPREFRRAYESASFGPWSPVYKRAWRDEAYILGAWVPEDYTPSVKVLRRKGELMFAEAEREISTNG